MWRRVNSGGKLDDESILRNISIAGRTYAMRRNWLTQVERQYVQTLLDEAIQHVKMRDMKLCAGFVQHAIQSRRMSTSTLSPNVIDKFAKDGFRLLQRMLNRHAGYKNLPCPLRGKALQRRAFAEGLVQRTMIVKVDARTVREECNMAEARRKMKMPEEIGKQCNHVLMVKTKRIQCVQAIKAQAIATGVADITRVWREFNSSTDAMTKVSLQAIAAVVTLKNVYVLDIHKMTCLFDFPTFKQMLDILTHSHIFAINMGEDAGMLDRRHFHLLAAKIREGSSAVRRWFAQSNGTRRAIWVECGLVRDNDHLDKPNVFTVARRKDRALWKEGNRELARLAWLLAPESAFIVAAQYKTNLQDSTCNWRSATAAREVVISDARLLALATIAALPPTQI